MAAQRPALIAAFAPLIAGLVLAGCAAAPERGPAPGAEPAVREAAPVTATQAGSTLLEIGRAQRDNGNLAEAAMTIERALRIEPNNPSLWIELGEIKAADGDRAQAETMARKALTLAGGDARIEDRAYRLIGR
jgi:Tfp pilus assembly protein PilF